MRRVISQCSNCMQPSSQETLHHIPHMKVDFHFRFLEQSPSCAIAIPALTFKDTSHLTMAHYQEHATVRALRVKNLTITLISIILSVSMKCTSEGLTLQPLHKQERH